LRNEPIKLELVTNPSQAILPGMIEEVTGILVDGAWYLHQFVGDDLRRFTDRKGTLRRFAMMPGSAGHFLAGKLAAVGVVYVLLAVVALLTASLLPGMRIQNAGLVVLWIAATGGGIYLMTVILSTLASTPRAASVLTNFVVMLLGLMGGTFFPFEMMPGFLSRIGKLTPNGWALLRLKELLGGQATPAAFEKLAAAPHPITLSVVPAGKRQTISTGFQQAVPGTMVMFLLLVMFTSGSVSLLHERKEGILLRLASTPMSRGAVVMGKWLARWTLGLIQIAFAMLAGSVLFKVDWGQNLAAVVAVLVAYGALAGAALSIPVATVPIARPRTELPGWCSSR
jgi:ABC-type multidrug transport system permease subunit